jgi:hypothetical protein
LSALGKVVSSFLMFVGLVFLTTFTGQLSLTLVSRRFGPKAKGDDDNKKLMNKTKEFVKDKIDQAENPYEDNMETLFMVIKSLNDKGGKKYTN